MKRDCGLRACSNIRDLFCACGTSLVLRAARVQGCWKQREQIAIEILRKSVPLNKQNRDLLLSFRMLDADDDPHNINMQWPRPSAGGLRKSSSTAKLICKGTEQSQQ